MLLRLSCKGQPLYFTGRHICKALSNKTLFHQKAGPLQDPVIPAAFHSFQNITFSQNPINTLYLIPVTETKILLVAHLC